MGSDNPGESNRDPILEHSQCEEKEYLQQIRFYREMVENALTGICIIQDNRIVYLNSEQQQIAGSMPMLFKSLPFERVHPDDLADTKARYIMAWKGEIRNVDMEFRYFSLECAGIASKMKWIQARSCLIQYQGRDALLINMMDVTKAHRLEWTITMQDKMASLGRVTAGLAHEIRNPLSGINIGLSMLEKIFETGADMQKIPGILKNMQHASNRVDTVIKRIMDFSKPNELKMSLCDIKVPIEQAMVMAEAMLREYGIKLVFRAIAKEGLCYLDNQLIEQVLLNLITNAAEAMQGMDGPQTIVISTGVEDGYVEVRVADSGPGIALQMRSEIFDPFFTTKTDSTGIGLSICQRIISDHKGSLQVGESSMGGAEFIISLPQAKEGSL